MTKLFAIAIGFDDTDGTYFANVHSLTDNKVLKIQSSSSGRILKEIDKSVRAKLKEIRNFPLTEPGRILGANGQPASEPPKLEIVK